jgi:hypothetical protein
MEGRVIWSEEDARKSTFDLNLAAEITMSQEPQAKKLKPDPSVLYEIDSPPASIIQTTSTTLRPRPVPTIKVLLSVDFDAVSGWLGTGQSAENNLADYSTGFFSAYVGVPRLLKLFRKHGIQDRVTWFVPMHSAESFPKEFQDIIDSGCEIGLHGYCHEVGQQIMCQGLSNDTRAHLS